MIVKVYLLIFCMVDFSWWNSKSINSIERCCFGNNLGNLWNDMNVIMAINMTWLNFKNLYKFLNLSSHFFLYEFQTLFLLNYWWYIFIYPFFTLKFFFLLFNKNAVFFLPKRGKLGQIKMETDRKLTIRKSNYFFEVMEIMMKMGRIHHDWSARNGPIFG